MQYRIQFLDAASAVISDLIADARSVHGAVALVADLDWPPHAVAMRVLDVDGREVLSGIKGDANDSRADGRQGQSKKLTAAQSAEAPLKPAAQLVMIAASSTGAVSQ